MANKKILLSGYVLGKYSEKKTKFENNERTNETEIKHYIQIGSSENYGENNENTKYSIDRVKVTPETFARVQLNESIQDFMVEEYTNNNGAVFYYEPKQ